VRGALTKLQRATCGALVVIDVHARDVTLQLAEQGVDDVRNFKWESQLRCGPLLDEHIQCTVNASSTISFLTGQPLQS
jgi:hypothetical protein